MACRLRFGVRYNPRFHVTPAVRLKVQDVSTIRPFSTLRSVFAAPFHDKNAPCLKFNHWIPPSRLGSKRYIHNHIDNHKVEEFSDAEERSMARKRSLMFGSLWGAASGIVVAVPPVSSVLFVANDTTAILGAFALVGSYTLVGSITHHFLIGRNSEHHNEVTVFEGLYSGAICALSAHLLVPLTVFVAPAMIDYGIENCASVVDWMAMVPVDLLNYGSMGMWWGVIDFGWYSIPGSVATGGLVAKASTHLIIASGLNKGKWSNGPIDDDDVIVPIKKTEDIPQAPTNS
eukprot:m.62994 g.62994  ORF g.62994 m.62994 type:complete len:288 (-) comp23226_c1_seq1:42-905(-)